MLNEEALLGRIFPEYVAYARQTARLIPGVW
jgi:protein-S-isoprenylcysteine O-methyltransferase Ste14